MNKINHIAIIMDGNGRWGRKRGKSRNFGHLKGVGVSPQRFSITFDSNLVLY